MENFFYIKLFNPTQQQLKRLKDFFTFIKIFYNKNN